MCKEWKRPSSCLFVYGTFQSIPHGHKDTPVLEQVFDEPFVDMFTDTHKTSELVFKGFVIHSCSFKQTDVVVFVGMNDYNLLLQFIHHPKHFKNVFCECNAVIERHAFKSCFVTKTRCLQFMFFFAPK